MREASVDKVVEVCAEWDGEPSVDNVTDLRVGELELSVDKVGEFSVNEVGIMPEDG